MGFLCWLLGHKFEKDTDVACIRCGYVSMARHHLNIIESDLKVNGLSGERCYECCRPLRNFEKEICSICNG